MVSRTLLGPLMAFITAGCTVSGGAGPECSTDADCPPGSICKDGFLCVDEDAPFAGEGQEALDLPPDAARGEGEGEGGGAPASEVEGGEGEGGGGGEGEGEGEGEAGGEGEGEGEGEGVEGEGEGEGEGQGEDPCGNGEPDEGEDCDPAGAPPALTCTDLEAHHRGVPGCTERCTFDPTRCVGGVCGDGAISQGETCDPSASAGARCTALGLKGGPAACDEQCQPDLPSCSRPEDCRNGWLDRGEECDPLAPDPECGACRQDCSLDAADCPAPCLAECIDVGQAAGTPPWALTPLGPATGRRLFDSICHRSAERTEHDDNHGIGVRVSVRWGSDGPAPEVEVWEALLDAVDDHLEEARIELFLERSGGEGLIDGAEAALTAVRDMRLADPTRLPIVVTALAVAGLPSAHGIVLNSDNPPWLQSAALLHLLGRFAGLSATHACPDGIPEPPGDCERSGDGLCDTLFDPGPAAAAGGASGACGDLGRGEPACALHPGSCRALCPGEATPDTLNALSHYLREDCADERRLSPSQALVMRCALRNEQAPVAFPLCVGGESPRPERCSAADEDCDGRVDEGRCPPGADGEDDGFDDNDDRAAAAALLPELHERLWVGPDDPDWYAIDVEAWRELSVRALFDGATADVDLVLEDPAGDRVSASSRTGDSELVVAQTGAIGARFLLGVLTTAPAGYQLDVKTVALQCLDLDGDRRGRHCPDGDDCDEGAAEIHAGAQERCNGLDDDCDGETDEGFGVQVCGQGECRHDLPECVEGQPGECDELGRATTERCDPLDHDCDGDPSNAPGVGNPCFHSLGECRGEGRILCDAPAGIQSCSARAAQPQAESCDGRDNDCDGLIDNAIPGLHFEFSDPLGPPPPAWAPTRGVWQFDGQGAMVGRATPVGDVGLERRVSHFGGFHATAVFDRSDADVGVGLTINGLADGQPGRQGLGARWEPSAGRIVVVCPGGEQVVNGVADVAPPGTPVRLDLVYDGLDLLSVRLARADEPLGGPIVNAAGCANTPAQAELVTVSAQLPAPESRVLVRQVVIDAPTLTRGCYSGLPATLDVGTCRAGHQLCQAADFAGDCINEVTPVQDELCDAVDDDCDGGTDEEFDVGEECVAGDGVCAVAGSVVCAPDGLSTDCDAVADAAAQGPPACNLLDDDCDGDTDEGFGVGLDCVIEVGACKALGRRGCIDGGGGSTCVAPELCNGVDDDCDGEADEGVLCRPQWRVERVVYGEQGYSQTSLAIDPTSDRPAISYAVAGRADLSRQLSDGWSHETITGDDTIDSTSLAFAGDGVAHVIAGRGVDATHLQMRSSLGGWLSRGPVDGHAPGSDRAVYVGPEGVVRWVVDLAPGSRSWSWREEPAVFSGVEHAGEDFGTPSIAYLPGSPYAVSLSGVTTSSVRYCDRLGDLWECAEVGDDLGSSTSLAVDADNDPWISFHNERTGALQVARRQNGRWSIETVDDETPAGVASSLAIDDAGRAQIAYIGGAAGHVRHAVRQSTGHWTLDTVDGTGRFVHTSLAIATSGVAHISYAEASGREIRHAWQPLSTDLSGYPDQLRLDLTEAGATSQQKGTASRPRTQQLFELPLWAGPPVDDPSVVVYDPLDRLAADRNGVAGGAVSVPGGVVSTHADAGRLDGGSERTACAWVRPTSNPGGSPRMVMIKGPINSQTWNLQISNGEAAPTAVISWSHPGLQATLGVGAAWPLPLGEWGHLCGTLEAGVASLYIAGVLVGTNPAGGAAFVLADNGSALTVGSEASFPGSYNFLGDIDEALVLDRAMSGTEIRALAQSWATRSTPTLPGAQADFDDVRILEDGREIEFEVSGAMPLGTVGGDLDGDVLHYWPLDGGRADELVGESAGAVNGARSGRGRFGDPAGSLVFDGDDWVDLGLSFTPAADDVFTIELWARDDAVAGQGIVGTLLGYDNSAAGGEVQLTCEDGGFRVALYSGPNQSVVPLSTLPCRDGRWHHLAMVRGGGRVRLFVDGLPAGDAADTTDDIAPGIAMLMGARHRPGPLRAQFFEGALDDVVIHSVARSADYIARRAHPVPRLRWFARTDAAPDVDGRHPFARYSVHWGAGGAAASPMQAAQGLLGPERGYLLWWRFADGVVDRAVDSTRAGIHGAFNQVVAGAGSTLDAAIDLQADGVRAPLRTSERDRIPYSDSLTVEVVVRATGDQTERVLLDEGGDQGSNLTWRAPLDSGDRGLSCRLPNGEGTVASGPALQADRWYALACAAGPGALRSYVDGALAGSDEARADALQRYQGDLVFGANTSGEHQFAGRFDEIRVMGRTLPPEELLSVERIRWSPAGDPQ